jgi:hypothetical protein
MRLLMRTATTVLLLVCTSERTGAKEKTLVEKAQEQLEKIHLAQANAVDAVRELKALEAGSEQLKVLEVKYGKVKDLYRISAAQTADAIRGISKIPPTMTETAKEAASSLTELIRFVRESEADTKSVPGMDFADVQRRKSKLAQAAKFAWDHKDEIEKLVQLVQKQYTAFVKLHKDQREALAKEADAAGQWPDFEKI